MYACFCGSIIQCVVKQPTFAPCHLLFYLTDVADDMNNMPCTLSKIDTMIFFALHLCLLCWHGNPVVWWSSPHYEQCQIMLLIFWTYSLFSNLKLDRIDRTVIIFVYTRAKPVISLLCFRVICLMACTSLLKAVRQTQHILQQRRQNILKIARQPQSLVLMQCSSYLRLTVTQAHRIRVWISLTSSVPSSSRKAFCNSTSTWSPISKKDCGEHQWEPHR